ncbi:MAG: hypothetical protein ABSD03_14525 [Vulcanimicrobiaceae bacterium]
MLLPLVVVCALATTASKFTLSPVLLWPCAIWNVTPAGAVMESVLALASLTAKLYLTEPGGAGIVTTQDSTPTEAAHGGFVPVVVSAVVVGLGVTQLGALVPLTLITVVTSEAELGETYCGLRAATEPGFVERAQLKVTVAVCFQPLGALVGTLVGVGWAAAGETGEDEPPPPHPDKVSARATTAERMCFTEGSPGDEQPPGSL